MPWSKGQSGNPKGSKPEKMVRDAIKVALSVEEKDGNGNKVKRLRIVAEQLVKKAMDGDITAIKEIADRIDGKAAQPLTGDDLGPIQIQKVVHEVIDPKNPDS